MKVGRITQLTNEPLQCSQGGIPFNKPHLDAAETEIATLRARVAELGTLVQEALDHGFDIADISQPPEMDWQVRAHKTLAGRGK